MSAEALKKIISDKERYAQISCVMSDFHMPQMNGLEFLEKVPTTYRRILLTAVASESLAIEALNSGSIDQFYRKDDIKLLSKLSKNLTDQEAQFLKSFYPREDSALQELLIMFRVEHNICEIYKLDSMASMFLLISENGEEYLLHSFNESDFKYHVEEGKIYGVSASVLEKIEKHMEAYCPSFDEEEELSVVVMSGKTKSNLCKKTPKQDCTII